MTIDEIREIQTNLMNLKHYNIAPNVLAKASNGLEELKSYKELDLEIPQHFTKEQSDWIKKYCIEKNKEFYKQGVDDYKAECHKQISKNHEKYGFNQRELVNLDLEEIDMIAEKLKGGGK